VNKNQSTSRRLLGGRGSLPYLALDSGNDGATALAWVVIEAAQDVAIIYSEKMMA